MDIISYLNINLKEYKLKDFFLFVLPELAKDKKEVDFIFNIFFQLIKETSDVKKLSAFFKLINKYIPFEKSLLLTELTEMFNQIGEDSTGILNTNNNSNIKIGLTEFIQHIIFNDENIENNIYNILFSSPYLDDDEKVKLFYYLSNSIYLSATRIQSKVNHIFNIPFFYFTDEKKVLQILRKIEYFNNNEEDLSLSSNILNSLLHNKSSTNRGSNFVFNSNIVNILEKNEDIETTDDMMLNLINLIKVPCNNVMFDKYVVYSLYIFTSLLRKKDFLNKCNQIIIIQLIEKIINEMKNPLKKNNTRNIVYNEILSLFYVYKNFDFKCKFTNDLKISINDFFNFYNSNFQEPNVLFLISNQVKEILELQKEVIEKKDNRFRKNKTIIDIYIENMIKEKNITSKSELSFLASVNMFAGDILFENRDFYFFLKKEHNVFKNWIKEFDYIFYNVKKLNTTQKDFELKKRFLINCMEKNNDILFSLLMKNPYFMRVIFINDRQLFEESFKKLGEIISKSDMVLSKIMLFRNKQKDFNLSNILNTNDDFKELNKEFVLNYTKKSIQMEIIEDIKHYNLIPLIELIFNKILKNYSHLNNIDDNFCTDLFTILTNKDFVATNTDLLKKLYKDNVEVLSFIEEEIKKDSNFNSEENLYKTLIDKISIKKIVENIKEIIKSISIKEINVNSDIKFNF